MTVGSPKVQETNDAVEEGKASMKKPALREGRPTVTLRGRHTRLHPTYSFQALHHCPESP
jgi:hypothetical protein